MKRLSALTIATVVSGADVMFLNADCTLHLIGLLHIPNEKEFEAKIPGDLPTACIGAGPVEGGDEPPRVLFSHTYIDGTMKLVACGDNKGKKIAELSFPLPQWSLMGLLVSPNAIEMNEQLMCQKAYNRHAYIDHLIDGTTNTRVGDMGIYKEPDSVLHIRIHNNIDDSGVGTDDEETDRSRSDVEVGHDSRDDRTIEEDFQDLDESKNHLSDKSHLRVPILDDVTDDEDDDAGSSNVDDKHLDSLTNSDKDSSFGDDEDSDNDNGLISGIEEPNHIDPPVVKVFDSKQEVPPIIDVPNPDEDSNDILPSVVTVPASNHEVPPVVEQSDLEEDSKHTVPLVDMSDSEEDSSDIPPVVGTDLSPPVVEVRHSEDGTKRDPSGSHSEDGTKRDPSDNPNSDTVDHVETTERVIAPHQPQTSIQNPIPFSDSQPDPSKQSADEFARSLPTDQKVVELLDSDEFLLFLFLLLPATDASEITMETRLAAREYIAQKEGERKIVRSPNLVTDSYLNDGVPNERSDKYQGPIETKANDVALMDFLGDDHSRLETLIANKMILNQGSTFISCDIPNSMFHVRRFRSYVPGEDTLDAKNECMAMMNNAVLNVRGDGRVPGMDSTGPKETPKRSMWKRLTGLFR